MPKEKGELPNSEQPIGDKSLSKAPVKISQEALELLSRATIPTEFLRVVREFIPQDFSASVETEGPPIKMRRPETLVDPEPEMPNESWPNEPLEPQLEMSVEPDGEEVAWTTHQAPPGLPEEIPREELAETFYLTDLKLDLSRVAYITSGLNTLALSTLSPIVLNLPAFWGIGQVYFFQDGSPPDGEDEEDDDVEEPPKTCDAEFVSERRNRDWYRNNGFGEKLRCPQTRKIMIPGTKSIPIYWAIAGTQWTDAEVREKLEKAQAWFLRYCISLRIKQVPLQQDASSRFSVDLARANTEGEAKYTAKVREIYKQLWENGMKRRRRFLLLLFVDSFNKVAFDTAKVDTSGNFAKIPVILITSADKTSAHIVTHELVHGLGKGAIRGSPPTSVPWVDAPGTKMPESVANGNQ